MSNPTPGVADIKGMDRRDELITRFTRAASLEMTQPTGSEIGQVALLLPQSTEVFISDVPRRTLRDAVAACAAISAAGLAPVPHIAVRAIDGARQLEWVLGECVNAGARKAMLIAGDRPSAAGPFSDVAQALRSGVIEASGIREIALAGYPDGHPKIGRAELDGALETKHRLLDGMGIGFSIVSQFCFEPDRIASWITQLRGRAIMCPISVGIVGPASAAALVRFAARCGVRTSARNLARDGIRLGRALTSTDPGRLLGPLAVLGQSDQNRIRMHLFSFGGAVPAARWLKAIQEGRFEASGDTVRVHEVRS